MGIDGLTPEGMAQFRQALKDSKHLLILAGAGLSAASGLPTFRGTGGLWRNYDALKLATPDAFASNPPLVWSFYFWRLQIAAQAQANPAHYALARLMHRRNSTANSSDSDAAFVTQNVDGLSRRAQQDVEAESSSGPSRPTQPLYEMHGDLLSTICSTCRRREAVNLDAGIWAPLKRSLGLPDLPLVPLEELPHCHECGGLLRPGVVWFGETPHYLDTIDRLVKRCDMMLVVGTSSTVYPAAGLSREAQRYGAKVAVFNLEKSEGDQRADFSFLGPCEEILPQALGEEEEDA